MEKTHMSLPLKLYNDTGQNILSQEGAEVRYTKDYGCGLDVHRKFIQVSVLVKHDLSVFEYRHEFNTDWESVLKAKEWVLSTIKTYSSPVIDPSNSFHYVLESTSTYHCVIIAAWKGIPSIVNPSLARAGSKKTDVLDAKTLAVADLTSIWPASFIPDTDIVALRLLVDERTNCIQKATRIGNHINNTLLRLGINVSVNGSVAKNQGVRSLVVNMIQDAEKSVPSSLTASSSEIPSPPSIPHDLFVLFRNDYAEYDRYRKQADDYLSAIISKIHSMQWETAMGTISGKEMMKILTSAPGVGVQTAVIWLSRVITPRRFRNEKALAAYCGCDPSLKVSAGKVTSTVKRGGRKDLHSAFCMTASNLMRRHSEPFGKFGYRIAMQTKVWKKGVNALARKLVVALYYMVSRGEVFSYEKYRMIQEPNVLNVSIETLVVLNPAFRRYLRYLMKNDITDTKSLVHQFYICTLPSIKGLGKHFFALVNEFIENQNHYVECYERMCANENH
ncbi:MAG: IS110 family transposase [Clostridia bacterium]|nr:IS110 family transposase [Clostridia bacterium]